jgi:hypothetical protein
MAQKQSLTGHPVPSIPQTAPPLAVTSKPERISTSYPVTSASLNAMHRVVKLPSPKPTTNPTRFDCCARVTGDLAWAANVTSAISASEK